MTIGSELRQNPRLGGCALRLFMGVLILAIGSFTYYCHTQKNPITGENQRVSITPDQEVQLGLEAAPEMVSEMGGEVPPGHPLEQLVESTGQRLARNLPSNPYKFDFHLLRDEHTVNAFALPGGQIFITSALFNRLETEAQLAGVLGHEIGHVVHRHAAQQMATSQFYQSIVMATGVGTGDNRAAVMAQYITQIRSLKYSRGDELQSDEWGLKLMAEVGLDPREMLGVMQILASLGNSGNEMLSTHPLPQSRIDKINEYLAKTYPSGVPSNLTRGRPLH